MAAPSPPGGEPVRGDGVVRRDRAAPAAPAARAGRPHLPPPPPAPAVAPPPAPAPAARRPRRPPARRGPARSRPAAPAPPAASSPARAARTSTRPARDPAVGPDPAPGRARRPVRRRAPPRRTAAQPGSRVPASRPSWRRVRPGADVHLDATAPTVALTRVQTGVGFLRLGLLLPEGVAAPRLGCAWQQGRTQRWTAGGLDRGSARAVRVHDSPEELDVDLLAVHPLARLLVVAWPGRPRAAGPARRAAGHPGGGLLVLRTEGGSRVDAPLPAVPAGSSAVLLSGYVVGGRARAARRGPGRGRRARPRERCVRLRRAAVARRPPAGPLGPVGAPGPPRGPRRGGAPRWST